MTSSSIALTVAKYFFGTSVAAVSIAIGGLWYFQRSMIYPSGFPEGSRTNVPKPIELGMPYEDVTLTTVDHVKIKAYVILARRNPISTEEMRSMGNGERKQRMDKEMDVWAEEMGDEKTVRYAKSRPTVVFFCANAGNMGHRVPLARKFNVDNRCNVFMLSYRGYGLSEGHPSERGLKVDIDTAMQFVQAHPILGETKIVLYGQSLGGAACVYAGSKFRDLVSGVIVENTFLSLPSLVPMVMPQIPKFLLPVLLTELWDANHAMPLIPSTTPVLMIAGKNDELVKPGQMTALRELRPKGGRTKYVELEGGHNDTCLIPAYWEIVTEWLKVEIEGLYRPPPPTQQTSDAEESTPAKGETGELHEKDSASDVEDYHQVTQEEAAEAKKTA
ncbi:hypothetical protein IAU60_002370 [Kwoniella sp. DSM 27419]